MNRRKSKRQKRAQLIFVYTLMALSVITVVGILALVMLGYRFNRYDGKVEQGGLVQFDSRPSGAVVTIDGIRLANKTASKITAMSGQHTITIAKEGYTSWQKDVFVQAGGVLWLNYALLKPTKPTVTTVATLPTISSSMVSYDRKSMVVVAEPSNPLLYVISLNSDVPSLTKVQIPTSLYTATEDATTQTFSLVGLDKEARSAIVQHTYLDKSEYLSIDIRGGNAMYNINQSAGADIAAVDYRFGDPGTVYVVTAARELRRLGLASSTLSAPIVGNIAEFSQTNQTGVTYTTLPDTTGVRTIGYVSDGATKARSLGSTSGGDVYKVLASTYFGERYITTLSGTTVTISKGDLPDTDSSGALNQKVVATFTVAPGATTLRYSPGDNRFVMVQSGEHIAGYDLELMQSSRLTLATAPSRAVGWIDGYHWAAVAGGTATYYDFDGTNGQMIVSGASDAAVGLSENYKYLYSTISTPAGIDIVRSTMTN
ncbi:PEGA domain-containing protein [Candidatus Saccharibacteria bacterium]|nr:MAG: PEGA domain-containing protein [Candidatus Saccharibacteria bacterium]